MPPPNIHAASSCIGQLLSDSPEAGASPAIVGAVREQLRKLAANDAAKGTLRTSLHEPMDPGKDDMSTMARQETDHWSRFVLDRRFKFGP